MGMLSESLIGLDRTVSLGRIGPLARMRGPTTPTAGECAAAAHYAGERAARTRQSAGPADSAAKCPRDEGNPDSGVRDRPSRGYFGLTKGLATRHGHLRGRLFTHGIAVPAG